MPGADTALVPISDLPAWARPAFTVPQLNRVQSKLRIWYRRAHSSLWVQAK